MRIAVCDDEERDLNALCDLLSVCDVGCLPDRYDAAEPLLDKAGCYDLVFLDIEMGKPNGYEIASRLVLRTPHPLIVFVTHTEAYAVRGYGIAFRYLLKPVCAKALGEVLGAAERELRANSITVFVDGTATILDVREILYAEVLDHTAVLHTLNGTYCFRAALRELESQLPARCFAAPHQSYLVNLQYVRAAEPQAVLMTNGDRIPVSRRRRQEFQRQLHGWLGGGA